MIIIGAKGFAKELLQVLDDNGDLNETICFFDDISQDLPVMLYDRFRIIHSVEELKGFFLDNPTDFALGIGGPLIRYDLYKKIVGIGGKLMSIISNSASIGHFGTVLEEGLSIMKNTIIENDVFVGEGSLVHNGSILSHDVKVGKYCEISPGVKLLGKVEVGNFSHIGSNAVVLPNILIGSYVKVGAGAVVTRNVPNYSTVVGVPANLVEKL